MYDKYYKAEGGRRQKAGGRRLKQAEGRRQEAKGGRRQEAGGRRQEAGGRRQEAGGRRQEAKGGRRQEAEDVVTFTFGLLHYALSFLHYALSLIPRALCLRIIFSFCLLPFSLFASNPVTVIVSLSPPYTPFLNEYGSNGVNKLQVSLIVNDSRMVNYPAKLQMLIEHVGSGIVMRTGEYAAIAPIMLTGNVTEVFNGFDLNKYFLAQNNVFTGFDQSQYMQTGRIPEGQYRIGFRIVDAQRTNVVLSNTGYTQPGWFVLNDPPQINFPRNKEKVRVNDLQNVKLQWFPRHLGSLNAAFATGYQVELFAIRVPGMNPNQIAMSMPPDFTDVTNRTNYHLTNDKYLLEPGVEYAVRIKAIAGDDQLTLFQNKGYSDVFSFIYGSLCPEIENESTKTLGTYKVEITWDTDPLQTSFETRFRKAGKVNDRWHTRESFTDITEISNVLSPGVKYEYQIKATCTTVESDYSALDYFTMPYPPTANFECGADDTVTVSNTTPKANLQIGETIYYGQFPIRLTEVSGSNGMFTGKGRMRVPFLANIQVNMQFNEIKVNELNQVYEGELVSVYNPDSKILVEDASDYFSEGNQIGNIIDGVDSAAITLEFPIDNVSNLTVAVSGNTVTVNSGGQSVSTTIENIEEGTTIQDSDGNIYAVDGDGNVRHAGTSGTGSNQSGGQGGAGLSTNELSANAKITFENNGTWALDNYNEAYADSKFANEYSKIGNYTVPWKFIPIGKGDKVTAKLRKGNINLDSIKFKTPKGTEFYAKRNGNKLEITLIGARQRDGYELYAVYQKNDSTTQTLGKLNVASYPLMQRNVVLVNMCSGNVATDQITENLNIIYKPYGITWNVNTDNSFTQTSWDTDGDGVVSAGETGVFSVYSEEMQAVKTAYLAHISNNYSTEASYIFLVDGFGGENKTNLLGDMPLEYQFGFVANSSRASKVAKTIAHELGHGMFQLRHPFSDKYKIAEGTTDNLMDYTEGTELVKYQWDVMHDPQKRMVKWVQDEEEGEYAAIKNMCDNIPTSHPLYPVLLELCEFTKYLSSKTNEFTTNVANKVKGIFNFATKEKKHNTVDLRNYVLDSIPELTFLYINFNENTYVYLDTVFIFGGEEEITPKFPITIDQLSSVFENTNKERLAEVVKAINKYSNKFEINSVERMSHFLGQIGHESGGFNAKKGESACYTTKNINGWKIWFTLTWKEPPFLKNESLRPRNPSEKGYIKGAKGRPRKLWWTSLDCKEENKNCYEVPKEFVCTKSGEEHNKRFFSYVYQSEGENGDASTLDGYKYRGHGAMQLTWKKSYLKFQNWLEENYKGTPPNIVKDPTIIDTNTELFILSAMWFWGEVRAGKEKTMNDLADKDNYDEITLTINSGKKGISDRVSIINKLKNKLK